MILGNNGLGPLSGTKVLDFSTVMAGPACTMLLADFGAEVVKVEPPDGDAGRRWGRNRFGPDDQFSGLFVALNRNKRGVVLDLKSDTGREAVNQLIQWADVVVENYRPGTADRLGIGYDAARTVNPSVIYCSISGFGQDGPLRERPGFDMLLQAYAGHMSVTGEPGRPSVRSGPSPIDFLTGTNAALGIVMALLHRDRTGEGQYLETSLYDSAIELMTHYLADYTGSGLLPGKSGQYFAFSAPYGVFPAQDREFYIGASHQRSYETLCHAIDRDDLVRDNRFLSNALRLEHRDELHRELLPIFASRDASEWVELCSRLNIPASLVVGLDDVVTQAQARARKMVVDSGVDGVKTAGIPLKLQKTPGSIRRQVPTLGHDTDDVLRSLNTIRS